MKFIVIHYRSNKQTNFYNLEDITSIQFYEYENPELNTLRIRYEAHDFNLRVSACEWLPFKDFLDNEKMITYTFFSKD